PFAPRPNQRSGWRRPNSSRNDGICCTCWPVVARKYADARSSRRSSTGASLISSPVVPKTTRITRFGAVSSHGADGATVPSAHAEATSAGAGHLPRRYADGRQARLLVRRRLRVRLLAGRREPCRIPARMDLLG